MYLLELWFSLDICPGVGSLDHICTAALAKIGPKWKKSQILTKKGMNKYTVAYPQNGIVYGNPKNQTNNDSNTETKKVISFQSCRKLSLPESWSVELAFGGVCSTAWKQPPYMGKNIKQTLSPVFPGKSENAGVLDSVVKCPASLWKLLSAVFIQTWMLFCTESSFSTQ